MVQLWEDKLFSSPSDSGKISLWRTRLDSGHRDSLTLHTHTAETPWFAAEVTKTESVLKRPDTTHNFLSSSLMPFNALRSQVHSDGSRTQVKNLIILQQLCKITCQISRLLHDMHEIMNKSKQGKGHFDLDYIKDRLMRWWESWRNVLRASNSNDIYGQFSKTSITLHSVLPVSDLGHLCLIL